MVSKAQASYLRISPRKMGLIFDAVRGVNVAKAMDVLSFTNHKGAPLLLKVIKSAISNAKNKGYSEDGLRISKVVANAGPTMKRFRAASFGRAGAIRKRTSHLVVELDSSEKIVTNVKVK